MEKVLEKLAEQLLAYDEASLANLREKYRLRIEQFDGTKDWEKAVIAFGALARLEAWPGAGGKTVAVNTVSRKDADEATILDTNRRFRTFLDRVTGFSSKERVKRAKKAVEEEE